MNRLSCVITASAALAILSAAAPEARADVLSMRAEIHVGGGSGAGVGGAQQDEAFHKGATGGAYGALVGVEVAFIDVWVDHHQFIHGGDDAGTKLATWTQFMVGLDLDFERKAKRPPAEKGQPRPEAKKTGYIEIGLGFGFGAGTGQQVEPPLSNDQITDKGFLLEAKFGAGIALGKVFSIGVSLPVSGGYFFKNQGFANDDETHYYSVQGQLLLVFRGKFLIK